MTPNSMPLYHQCRLESDRIPYFPSERTYLLAGILVEQTGIPRDSASSRTMGCPSYADVKVKKLTLSLKLPNGSDTCPNKNTESSKLFSLTIDSSSSLKIPSPNIYSLLFGIVFLKF